MAEYIERQAAIREFETHGSGFVYGRRTCAAIISRLKLVPAADVRPVVKATWIVKEMQALFPGMDERPVFACSECGYQIYDLLDNLKERHHFCPNCGADMRGGEQDGRL